LAISRSVLFFKIFVDIRRVWVEQYLYMLALEAINYSFA